MKVWHKIYHKLITKENIFRGFKQFLIGKKKKHDVIIFGKAQNDNLKKLHQSLVNETYQPGGYTQFYVKDPKLRLIHKAAVIDRIVHHIVNRELEPIFEPTFIAHSYSCRKNKGTHRGILALQKLGLKASKNNSRVCWVLKCDIKKFFASINHRILLEILSRKIKDKEFLDLLTKIINSFCSDKTTNLENKKGIPIGNLTSQAFSNIYLNELDQFMKNQLKVKYYIRYADDFILLSQNKNYLENLLPIIAKFLKIKLDLELHPKKIIFRKFGGGVDFLGYIIFPYHILLRTRTKRRMLRKIKNKIAEFKAGKISEDKVNETIQSYFGYLAHANTCEFRKELENLIWFWLTE